MRASLCGNTKSKYDENVCLLTSNEIDHKTFTIINYTITKCVLHLNYKANLKIELKLSKSERRIYLPSNNKIVKKFTAYDGVQLKIMNFLERQIFKLLKCVLSQFYL